ncbi:LptF/LptG family permease [Klebsiella pneumoniae]|nr:LptF/LptG family permease [Klebsiella pneumoniae]
MAILFILLLIFLLSEISQDPRRHPWMAISQPIWVLSLLGLGIPEMAQLILPLSLFLGLLMTLGKLYTESEITVMHACGLSKAVLIKAAMILALFTGAVAAVNVMWAGPWSSRHQDEVLAEAKS